MEFLTTNSPILDSVIGGIIGCFFCDQFKKLSQFTLLDIGLFSLKIKKHNERIINEQQLSMKSEKYRVLYFYNMHAIAMKSLILGMTSVCVLYIVSQKYILGSAIVMHYFLQAFLSIIAALCFVNAYHSMQNVIKVMGTVMEKLENKDG